MLKKILSFSFAVLVVGLSVYKFQLQGVRYVREDEFGTQTMSNDGQYDELLNRIGTLGEDDLYVELKKYNTESLEKFRTYLRENGLDKVYTMLSAVLNNLLEEEQ